MAKRITKAQRAADEAAAALDAPQPDIAPPMSEPETVEVIERHVITVPVPTPIPNGEGIEQDVMEARALMAESRRQVRENVPVNYPEAES